MWDYTYAKLDELMRILKHYNVELGRWTMPSPMEDGINLSQRWQLTSFKFLRRNTAK